MNSVAFMTKMCSVLNDSITSFNISIEYNQQQLRSCIKNDGTTQMRRLSSAAPHLNNRKEAVELCVQPGGIKQTRVRVPSLKCVDEVTQQDWCKCFTKSCQQHKVQMSAVTHASCQVSGAYSTNILQQERLLLYCTWERCSADWNNLLCGTLKPDFPSFCLFVCFLCFSNQASTSNSSFGFSH